MTSQSQGIHQLLQAEKRAKDKLEEAKKSKSLPFRLICPGQETQVPSLGQEDPWE